MIGLEEFTNSVKTIFSFLEKEYKYKLISSQFLSFQYYVIYKKRNTEVRISYASRHDYIQIYFFFETNKYIATDQNYEKSLNLEDLINKVKKTKEEENIDFNLIMPNKIGLKKSLEVFANLLKNNAESVLKGKVITTAKIYKFLPSRVNK
jgi:hypothetical protein